MMLGCSDGGGPTPPVPGELSPPRVSATLGFGDAPLTGEVVLDPGVVPRGVAPWRYAIDLDGDGAADARGEAGTRTAVGYAFVAPGPHPIGIVLTRGVEEQSIEEVVVVNDPGKIEVLGSVELPTIDPMRDVFIGITVDRSGQNLFVGGLRQTDLPVYTLDATTLTLSDSVKLDMLQSHPEGLSAAPDEDRLYVAGRQFDFTVLSTPELDVVHYFERVIGQFAVLALPNRRAYVGGVDNVNGLALIDTQTGEILRQFRTDNPPQGTRNFALSPNRTQIALPTQGGEDGPDDLVLLGAEDLLPRWRVDLKAADTPGLPPGAVTINDGVAFSADGGRIYVMRLTLGVQGFGRVDFLVVDASGGQILRRMTIDRGCASFSSCLSGPNTVAISADGRFAAFSTSAGVFFVDRVLDLPLHRSPFDQRGTYCCGTAANPITEEFYFISLSQARVTKVRIRR